MDKVWLSKASVVVAAAITIICVVCVVLCARQGIEVPDRVWGLLGAGLMLMFGVQLPTPGARQ